MHINNPSLEEKNRIFNYLDSRLKTYGEPVYTKYLKLGTRIVRLINYSQGFVHHVETQLGYVLEDEATHYDTTLIIWQERDILEVSLSLYKPYNPVLYRQIRAKRMKRQAVDSIDMAYFDNEIIYNKPFFEVLSEADLLSAFNPDTNTYYYSAENLDAEEFIKKGHIFVQTFSKILKTPTTNLVHAAVIGLNDVGVLYCGIGYRGKSTFSINAMLHGFDYVSDDYLVLGKEDETLRAWPIYSIITMSPMVYKTMYKRFEGKFVSNNARKDKYVFNIENYHNSFRGAYPVKLCLYPRFVKDAEPSIVPGDKDIAVHELVMSSLRQMGDSEDVVSIAKMYSFVQDLPFYRINLTQNLDKNTQCLKEFLENFA